MKWLIIILSLLLVVGCATVLIVEERDVKGNLVRSIRAEDYSVLTPTLKAVPSRWLTPNFVAEIFKGVIGWQSIIPAVVPILNPVPVPSSPTPTSTPVPTPYPAPGPTPTPTPSSTPSAESAIFTRTGNIITLDLNTLPTSMRKAGWQGRDNALYYAMGSIYLHGPGPGLPVPSGGDAELAKLSDQRAEIYRWFEAETMKVKSTMMTYPAYTVVAVTNDGRDRVGSRLGPAIADRLKEFGSRVTTGYMMSESEY